MRRPDDPVLRGLPIEVLRLDHVAMAVWDAAGPARLLLDVLGASFLAGGNAVGAGYRWIQFAFPGGVVEVLEPLSRTGFLYRFLTRRGEGLHHLTLRVRDLEGAIPRLAAAGYQAVDVDLSHESWKEAFLHPRDTGGVLIQLAETPDPPPPEPPGPSLEELLAERPGLRPD